MAAGAALEVIFTGEDEIWPVHVIVATLNEGLGWIGGWFRHGDCYPAWIVAGEAGLRKAGWWWDFGRAEDWAGGM